MILSGEQAVCRYIMSYIMVKEDLDRIEEPKDKRTAAERAHEAAMRKRVSVMLSIIVIQQEEELIKKDASLSHKEKVQKFNKHLETLTEYHDVRLILSISFILRFPRCLGQSDLKLVTRCCTVLHHLSLALTYLYP